MAPAYSGLTWDHPRGRNALEAAAAMAPGLHGLAIAWEAQSLEDFEARPLAQLCSGYDLLVIDHPHVGEAAASGALRPIQDLLSEDELSQIGADTIGPCLESYRYAGRTWALPLDAATQVMVLRADRFPGEAPRTWAEVEAVAARTGAVALSLAGPHALLTLLSMAAAFYHGPQERDDLLTPEAGGPALELMCRLAALAPAGAGSLNPIGLLERMGREGDILLCPLVYGYVNYATPSSGREALRFTDAPSAALDRAPGSILGGTGIALSRRCPPSEALRAHLLWLMGDEAQGRFIPRHDGQPSRRSAWLDPDLNARSAGFYTATARTLEHATLRPRDPGYVPFQAAASARVRAALRERHPALAVIRELNDGFRRVRTAASEARGRAHA